MKKILVVLTNVDKYATKDEPTGLWLSEATHFIEEFDHNDNVQIDLVSPLGGNVPLDPKSLGDSLDESTKAYYENEAFMNKLKNTLKPSDVKASDYDAIYFTGGHGTMWDFPDNAELQELSREIYEKGGVVSGVCHGVTALLNVKLSNGLLLIKDKTVSGFTNEEEALVQQTDYVPFLLEDALRERAGRYDKAAAFSSYVTTDGRLVTGQNPQSSKAVGESVKELLGL
ncbi:type 1 glutamine amidotransferase domain-containing protein [Paenibacillus xylanexedens]|uniref:type 1 glutamine amidotransferase domain-containing protein n=1 Tax=Paenibacillus xylanexedens TaxID=528191 RepID=UPI0011AAD1A4|nr:type 1 glutamine amidotransferase domain-containing protein [Paenibacillus xylanexedens]